MLLASALWSLILRALGYERKYVICWKLQRPPTHFEFFFGFSVTNECFALVSVPTTIDIDVDVNIVAPGHLK